MEIIIPESKEAWLALRAKDITSSEAPALFGLSPYLTPFELWHRKAESLVVDVEEGERMKWGNRLETAIAVGIAQDLGIVVRPMKEYIRDGATRIGSSFDFRVVNSLAAAQGNIGPDSEFDELLEIKNVDALQFRDKWIVDGDDIEAPPHIEVQVQHQLLVSNLKKATIGALIGGNKVVLIKRDRDEKIISAIRSKAIAFWKSIDDKQPPAPDFTRDAEFIAKLYGYADPGKVIDASADRSVDELVLAYKAAGADEKEAQERKDAAKAELLTKIGDAEKVLGAGWSISAGMVGPAHIEYDRKPYRNFRINVKKSKEVANV